MGASKSKTKGYDSLSDSTQKSLAKKNNASDYVERMKQHRLAQEKKKWWMCW